MEVWDLLEKFANLLFGKIQTGLKQTLTLMGLITVFNGLGVKQEIHISNYPAPPISRRF